MADTCERHPRAIIEPGPIKLYVLEKVAAKESRSQFFALG
jgi:hypothetical protein